MRPLSLSGIKACAKKRYKFFCQYTFPATTFSVTMSLAEAGNMGRSVYDTRRDPLYKFLEVEKRQVKTLNQTHSKHIVFSSEWHDGIEGDGIISTDVYDVIGITSADCVPVFIFHPETHVFGAFHSGWKGTGISESGANILCERANCKPGDLTAFIGPSIGACCYNVDDTRGAAFLKSFGPEAIKKKNNQWFIDLKSINIHLLSGLGINDIYSDSDCTCCNTSYGSFRREGPDHFSLMLSLGMY